MICADVAHLLHFSLSDLRRERWSNLLEWHAEACRIGRALDLSMSTVE